MTTLDAPAMLPRATTNGRIGTAAPIANRANEVTAASHAEPPSPFGFYAQLLAGQRIDGGRPIGEEVPDHRLRLARTQPLGLIDQLQLLALGHP